MEQNRLNVPKLRFLGFEEEWKMKKFSEVFAFKTTNSFSRENLNYLNGSVKNIHYGDIHTKFSTLFDVVKEKVPFVNPEIRIDKISKENYLVEGDIVFADASEDLNDVGKSIEIVNLKNEKVIAGLHTILARQISSALFVGFGGFLFKSNTIRLQIQKVAQGSKVLSISMGRLSNIELTIPSQLARKKKLLETYKKGVMQALFSQKLRFSGFVGEWEEMTIGELADVYQPKTISQHDFTDDGYLVYGANGIVGKYHSFNHELGQIAVTCRGNTCGQVTFTKPQSWITGNAMVINLDKNSKVSKLFLYNVLVETDFSYLITGSGQPQITSVIYSTEIGLREMFNMTRREN